MTNEEESTKLKNELLKAADSLIEIADMLPATDAEYLRCPRFTDAYQTVRAHRIAVGADVTKWDRHFNINTDLELMLFYLRLNHAKDNMHSLSTTGRDQ